MSWESTNTSSGGVLPSLTEAATRANSAVSSEELATVSFSVTLGCVFSNAGISVLSHSCWMLVSLSVTMVIVTCRLAEVPEADELPLEHPATAIAVAAVAAMARTRGLTVFTNFSCRVVDPGDAPRQHQRPGSKGR